MTTSMLKFIACILMLIDHIGAVLLPRVIILRMIGRLSFPIFAYLIAVGYSKTNSFYRYLYRLLIFAAASQLPFSLAFSEQIKIHSFFDFLSFLMGSPNLHLNIFFTLSIGLIAIRIWDKWESKFFKIISILALVIIAETFNTDYGLYGVAIILAFYIFRESKVKLLISQIIVYLVFNASGILLYVFETQGNSINHSWFIQILSILSLIFIFKYNGKKGKNLKYAFYVFYPMHLLILGIIKVMVDINKIL
ncbi:conjugal transfer protein TraX [Clostridium estertheticum]|uniref:TraX family protein n=1 Tax=Clostridium estertheticum TaxID=238834 RepID=UPI001C0CB41D|nr:TraX family protein [Clostridium estertheticum]MBU3175281.1 conjugal transfer protein TraX [Clostridium estertheticum]